MRAISVLSFETGTSTRWCLAAAALRRRVRKSAIGSVCIVILPAGFHDAGNFALQRHPAETDSAHLKLADIPSRAAAAAAAVADPHLEFRLLERLSDFCCACHLLRHPFFAERKPEPFEQLTTLLIVLRAGRHGDVHALDLVHARVIDFWKHQLVFQPQRVVSAAVEGILRQASEVAHTRQHHVAQAVEKFVHVVAAQRHSAANGHALANLEIRNGFLRPRDHCFLPGDLAKLHRRRIQQLGVLAGFAETDVDRDFLQLGHGHHVLPAKALHQRGHRLRSVFFLQSALHRLLCLSFYLSSVVFQCLPLGSFVSQCHGLPNLRSQRNNLREFLLAQFARYGAEHARPHRLARIVDQHRGVVVKPDVRAILAPPLFPHPHHHRFHHASFFDLAFRCRFLYRGGNYVAEARLQSRVAAYRHDAGQLARAGIVGHRQPGSHLNHWSAPLSLLLGRRVPRQHFFQPPALQLGKRPRSHDAHRVAGLGLAVFVVRVELFRDAHHPAVLGVLHQPLHFHHDRFLHLRAGYFAGEYSSLAALGNRSPLCFGRHYAFPAFSSCARTSVFTRARSFFASRSRFSASACPVESWKRSRKIVSVRSFSWASNSSTPASRILSMRRGIVKTLLRGIRISWEWAVCAPPVPKLPWLSLRPLQPSQT